MNFLANNNSNTHEILDLKSGALFRWEFRLLPVRRMNLFCKKTREINICDQRGILG